MSQNKLSSYLLHFLFPKTCVHCRRDLVIQEENPLCPDCLRQLEPLTADLTCQRCGIPLPSGGAHCHLCRNNKFQCQVIRSAFLFNPPLQSLIHELKYQERKSLVQPMGIWLREAFKKYPEIHGAQVLVPVPLYPERERRRGFNQSQLLAEELVKSSRAFVIPLLKRIRATSPQVDLPKSQRLENVKEAFQAAETEKIRGKEILLVDDVCTTGATLEECAKTLKKAGAKKVCAFTLARQAQ
ncbi:MAG: ComF family protein [Elusimicrobia bacterium]|nr:ComF family protein [Elusimicrobiota bacterium]